MPGFGVNPVSPALLPLQRNVHIHAIERANRHMTTTDVPALHVGIIMDGNGRWAEARGMGRIAGHARGARRVTDIVRACPDFGVTHLTLYAFSTENWARPLAEVEGLMRIFGQYIRTKWMGYAATTCGCGSSGCGIGCRRGFGR